MSETKQWPERVLEVLKEAEKMEWLATNGAACESSYDPVTKRITTTAEISTVVAQDMLARGVARIDASGNFEVLDYVLPPEERTTHSIGIIVRQVAE